MASDRLTDDERQVLLRLIDSEYARLVAPDRRPARGELVAIRHKLEGCDAIVSVERP